MVKMMSMIRRLNGLSAGHNHLFRDCDTHTEGKPVFKPRLVLAVVTFSVLVLGFADYATGNELGFFVFYFLPIAVAAWKLDSSSSYLIPILSATVSFLADIYSSHSYSNPFFAVWNAIIRLVSFLIIAYCTPKIRYLFARAWETSRDQLSQSKRLNGWIAICASCKKIRDDRGHWLPVEKYLVQNTDAQLTHGLCQDCVDKLLKEAGIDNSSSTAKTAKRGPPLDSKEIEDR